MRYEATAPWWAAGAGGAQRALGFCQTLCHPFWGKLLEKQETLLFTYTGQIQESPTLLLEGQTGT